MLGSGNIRVSGLWLKPSTCIPIMLRPQGPGASGSGFRALETSSARRAWEDPGLGLKRSVKLLKC